MNFVERRFNRKMEWGVVWTVLVILIPLGMTIYRLWVGLSYEMWLLATVLYGMCGGLTIWNLWSCRYTEKGEAKLRREVLEGEFLFLYPEGSEEEFEEWLKERK